ncbi:hypothetical protein KY337_02165 [Candidatus Woesearchaeota archaeon]|nr:hypothetical protein [Candidatus Woesearchaeota archaeon]
MLAVQGNLEDLDRKGYIFEPNLGGVRVFLYKNKNRIKILNASGKNVLRKYPEFNVLTNYIDAKSCILDAEIIVYNKGVPDFEKLQRRELAKRKDISISAKEMPATLVTTDILMKDGKNLKNFSLIKRKEVLENTVAETKFIEIVYYTDKGKRLWEKMLAKGIRGVVAKQKYSKYFPGKTVSNWIRVVF